MTPPPADPAAQRDALRKSARQRRAALDAATRRAAAHAVRDHLFELPAVRRARTVAAYLAHGSELDLGPTIAALQKSGTQIYLPRVLRSPDRLEFVRYEAGATLAANRHGILEPPGSAPAVAARFLQVVLLPLVAFDAAGVRLGSGVGYYDRCFGFRLQRTAWHAPLLVGVGFACQVSPAIPRSAWDVPLDRIVTESGVQDPTGAAT